MANELSLRILKDQYIPTAEFYGQLVDSLSDYAIFTMDPDLKINSWNSGSAMIFGYDADEVIGRNFDLIFLEEDRKRGVPAMEIRDALKCGRATGNRWHICKDGSEFYASGLVFPLTGSKGEELGYVKILRDLTKNRLSDNAMRKHVTELEELNAHKENILAILSHDLRSPLGGIIGASEYLKNNFTRMNTEEVREMLDLLHRQAVDELVMLDYLVEWARIKHASEVFSPENLRLREYVEKVFDTLGEIASSKNVSLQNELDQEVMVFADGKMLISIIQNIVSNALKHTPSGGSIIVSSEIRGPMVVVSIKDNGAGMPEAERIRLFEAQIGKLSAVRKTGKGAGIGLLLVNTFLEKNGGEIWAESIEGVGSVFHFTLPLAKPVNT